MADDLGDGAGSAFGNLGNSMVAKKTQKRPTPQSVDEVMLDVVIWEFPSDDPKEAERKIRRRLRHHDLGPFQQERVELLRRLKNETYSEIRREGQSRYFAGRHGDHSAVEDFDIDRLIGDLSASYPDVPREEIERFIPWAIYLYYLR
jgi:hypothetical protein